MTTKTLQELEALRDRMEGDIRRSRLIQVDGLSRNTPLIKNYEQVKQDIKALKESK